MSSRPSASRVDVFFTSDAPHSHQLNIIKHNKARFNEMVKATGASLGAWRVTRITIKQRTSAEVFIY
jgi:hypothetical protein